MGFSCGSDGKEFAFNVGDLGLIPGLERFPGEGKGSTLQYSGLENSIDCIVHGVAKSQTWLSDFHSLKRFSISNEKTSLVTQMIKNPPAMRGTWARSLGQEDLLEKGSPWGFPSGSLGRESESEVSSRVWHFGTPWFLHPRDFPGKDTGVGCHFLLNW